MTPPTEVRFSFSGTELKTMAYPLKTSLFAASRGCEVKGGFSMTEKENGALPDMRAADKPDKEISAELGIEVSAR